MSAEPLVVEFEVGVAPHHAFETWTQRCPTWWPRSHTMSGAPSAITFEPRGWERLGDAAVPRRTRTEGAWDVVTAAFADAL
jgi:hypothetical protein